MTPQRRARGFTLIELMVVTAIIALLASMAIPTFTKLTLRTKAAERHEVMLRIKKAVSDFYVQNGSIKDKLGTKVLIGDFQPPLPPTTTKKAPNWMTPGWTDIWRSSEEIMGATYYSYRFDADDTVVPATLTITAVGDLDGDGAPSVKVMVFERVGGVYQLVFEDPPPGAEDSATF